jgi:hypothetical protein
MKAKEKAKELFEQMISVSDKLNKYPMCFDTARACALIAINEIQKTCLYYGDYKKHLEIKEKYFDYWQEVKQKL